MKKSILPIALAISLVPLAAATEPSVLPPNPLPLSWCLEHAFQANPTLVADAARADAARHRIGPAGSLEDPRIGYEASNVPIGEWDFKSTPLSGHQFGLHQRVPFPGLLGQREAGARAGAEAAVADLEDRRVTVAASVEQAWTELGFAQRALEVTDHNVELLRQLVQIAEARYGVGSGLQQDVLRAHVELTSLLQQRLRREAAIRASDARLAALLDLSPEDGFPRTANLREEQPLPDLAGLLARLETASPRLRARAALVEEADRRRRATQLEGYPDFDLGVGYRIRRRVSGDPVHGDDFVSAGVTIRFPVNRAKWRERVAEHEALIRRARAELRAERNQLQDRLRTSFAELVRSDEEVSLIETGLLPQARQSLESSRAGYEVGRVDFPSLVDTQINLFEAELRLVRAIADRRAAFAALEAAAGEELR